MPNVILDMVCLVLPGSIELYSNIVPYKDITKPMIWVHTFNLSSYKKLPLTLRITGLDFDSQAFLSFSTPDYSIFIFSVVSFNKLELFSTIEIRIGIQLSPM